jgi:hypothetical protein
VIFAQEWVRFPTFSHFGFSRARVRASREPKALLPLIFQDLSGWMRGDISHCVTTGFRSTCLDRSLPFH